MVTINFTSLLFRAKPMGSRALRAKISLEIKLKQIQRYVRLAYYSTNNETETEIDIILFFNRHILIHLQFLESL